ncbi:MAG: SpoIIE family protein phosphatase [Bacteroidales bacterium]|nr:SpoIIE family protein phosphatase [Bacteroidales bacterium]
MVHKVMKYFKQLILVLILGWFGQGFAQEYNLFEYGVDQGMSQRYVYTITQDNQGYLWVGTENGLLKFNGFHFDSYTTADSLADNFISCSFKDNNGIWFGHMNGQITHFDGKRFTRKSFFSENSGNITAITRRPNGQIWASSYTEGLVRIDGPAGKPEYIVTKEDNPVFSFQFISENEFFLGTLSGIDLYKINSFGIIEDIDHLDKIPDSKVQTIIKMRSDSGFFVATENAGIYKLTPDSLGYRAELIGANLNLNYAGVQDIFEDSQSNLWICTFGSGLIKLKYSFPGKFTQATFFNPENGFPTKNVKTAYEDREGNIWSGNFSVGLTRITQKSFILKQFDENNYSNSIYALFVGDKYEWLGTDKGLLKVDKLSSKPIRNYSSEHGLPKDRITAIYPQNDKNLWIGTENSGMYRLLVKQDKIVKIYIGKGILENSITTIAGKGAEVWVGTKKGVCNINTQTNERIWYNIHQGGLPHNYVNHLFFDTKGRLWISTLSNVLAYIQKGRIEKIYITNDRGIFTLGPIAEDNDSNIWVGSIGSGVFQILKDSITNFTTENGLISNFCYSLVGDKNNNIWVGHRGGVSRLRTIDYTVKPIQQQEGILSNIEFNKNAAFIDHNEMLWFGTNNGIISYDFRSDNKIVPPPLLSITSLKVNDKKINFEDVLVLKPGKYTINLEFLGLSLKEPDLVKYQYKLEGYNEWSEVTKINSVTYPGLSEGRYTFMLNAINSDGISSLTPLRKTIIIKTPVWKHWWFYVLTFLTILSIIYIYIKRREDNLLKKTRILEEKVQERTAEIQRQNDELEKQSNLIKNKNKEITDSIRYASRIQSAIIPPIELLNRIFNENFILSKPKDIVSGDFYWLAKKEDKIIITVADCTGHGVPGAFMSMLGITFLNEIVNGPGKIRPDIILDTLKEKVITALRQNEESSNFDGLDLSLCVIDQDFTKLQYAGALNNMVHISNGNLNILKADRMPVGISLYEYGKFSMKELKINKGDVLYMFSDGFQDQFGGEKDKKFTSKRLLEILLFNHQKPMHEQKEILDKTFIDWKRNYEQTDDITILGLRL